MIFFSRPGGGGLVVLEEKKAPTSKLFCSYESMLRVERTFSQRMAGA